MNQLTVQVGNGISVTCDSVEEAASLINSLNKKTVVASNSVSVAPSLLKQEKNGSKTFGLKRSQKPWLDEEVALLYQLYKSGVKKHAIVTNRILNQRHSPSGIQFVLYNLKADKFYTKGWHRVGVYKKYKELQDADAAKNAVGGGGGEERTEAGGGGGISNQVPVGSWDGNA